MCPQQGQVLLVTRSLNFLTSLQRITALLERNPNECHNGIVVLDLPVDALVYEPAGFCKGLALVLVSDIKPDYIRMVGKNLVCHPNGDNAWFDHRSVRRYSVFSWSG